MDEAGTLKETTMKTLKLIGLFLIAGLMGAVGMGLVFQQMLDASDEFDGGEE